MYTMVFDTETTSLNKPFCYDVGYCIIDMETYQIVKCAHYIIEQNWHNLPLFESAYYAQKRPLYVKLMRQHKAILEKWGYVMQKMYRDIKSYNIQNAYAYNCSFDEKVFNFNCEWFHTINPFDTIAIHDIWGYASQFITCQNEYKQFCEDYNNFTDSGNYSGNAETVYRFITQDPNFIEQHMGLHDAEIESKILLYCIQHFNADWNTDYKVIKILQRPKTSPFTIQIDGQTIYSGEYIKKISRNDRYNFITK